MIRKLQILLLCIQLASACWWVKKDEEKKGVKRYPTRVRSPTIAPKMVKRRPVKKKGKPRPKPTEFVGDKPTWEFIKQKGNTCISETTAAVPCKDPIKVGKSCKDKYNWSNEGYIESEVHCLRNTKGPGVIRKEMRRECYYRDGKFQCWRHWSSTGCHSAHCQSDKLGNGWQPIE